MLFNLDDDVIQSIGAAVENIRCLGSISIVMLSRVCRRFRALFQILSDNAKSRWMEGFSVFHTWKVPRFRDRTERLYSPVFTTAHGHHWRLLLFCKGNGVAGVGPSVYLDVSNAIFLPEGWSRRSKFKLQFQHNVDETQNIITPPTDITFCKTNKDWGYRVFVPHFDYDSFCNNFVDADGAITICCEIHTDSIVPSSIIPRMKVCKPYTRATTYWKKQVLSEFLSRDDGRLFCTLCEGQLSQRYGNLICSSRHVHNANLGVCLVSRIVQPHVKCAKDATPLTMTDGIDEYSLHPTLASREVVWRIGST